jgi:hypothetical protein
MFQLQLILLHCDEWDRVVALPRHKFVTGATLLQLGECNRNTSLSKIKYALLLQYYMKHFIQLKICE